MSLFHAFYVVSYTATTIGFGEIPNAFRRRAAHGMILTIHLTVIGWTYTLGSIFALVSDITFSHRRCPQHVHLAGSGTWRKVHHLRLRPELSADRPGA